MIREAGGWRLEAGKSFGRGQDGSLAISVGVALSFYRDELLIGIAGHVYDRRLDKDQTQDYVITIKYAGFLDNSTRR